MPTPLIDKLEVTPGVQGCYDAFNAFVFSPDIRIMSKLLFRAHFFELTKDVPGDIVECGVFKGSGLVSWLKIKQTFAPNAFKRVVGFDMFDSVALLQSLSGQDKAAMTELFAGRSFEMVPSYFDYLTRVLTDLQMGPFDLIPGNVIETAATYARTRPGAKISILYLDLDLEEPTYQALAHLWPLVSNGGYVIFDEYGYHTWSESRGVDRFVKEHGLKLRPLDCNGPTAYLVK